MTDIVETSNDPFDDIFSGNGAGGTGLDLVCDQPCIFVPQEYKKGNGMQNKDGSDKYMIVTTVISFANPENPEVHEELPVFGSAVVDMLKKMALKNESGTLTEKGFPFMRVAVPFRNEQKKKAGNAQWDFKAVEDPGTMKVMAAYAHKNLKPASPFE